ncbi:hypothetical protein V6N11_023084 [Hibiscus sabdariffa]|uniref:Ubiquitin-like domain-containing protein n=1 Tax=Hibiscus sabdariffa TaxID=183260 RepID=A0ABR2TL79_9ROSI
MPEEDLVELKFRLYDGSDIGPFRYSPASTVAMLKGRIVSEWPKDKKIAPKGANDIKLINSGKILENNKTVGQCRAPFDDLPKSVITMHVVVQPSATKANTGGRASAEKLLFVFRIVDGIECAEAAITSTCQASVVGRSSTRRNIPGYISTARTSALVFWICFSSFSYC